MGASRTGNARSAMIMRAIRQVNATTSSDAYGQPATESWSTTGDPIPCAAWTTRKTFVQNGNEQVLVEMIDVMVPRGTVMADEDRILNITDRLGTEIFAGPLQIQTMQVHKTFIELLLQRADSGVNLGGT